MTGLRAALIWAALTVAIIIPFAIAAVSPQLAWRDPIYIAAGFAGVAAMALLLVQPLLIGGYLPGPSLRGARTLHRVVGGVLVLAVVIHVVALWITSPPDVVDALLFTSATPFSAWGVVAMWAVFSAAALAALRRKLRLRPKVWRLCHTAFAAVVVVGSVVHAMLIDGTMGPVSKAVLCVLAIAATLKLVVDLRVWNV